MIHALRRACAGALLVASATAVQAAGPTLAAYNPVFHAMSATNGADGQGPQGDLAVDGSNNLYGANFYLGASVQRCGCTLGGTVVKITPNGTTTALHTFTGPDGLDPSTSLLLAKDGNLYGMTAGGGDYGSGAAFVVSRSGTSFTLLHSFGGPANDGAQPWHGRLVQAADGKFYGTTSKGGTHDLGVVFRMAPTGAVTVLHHFAGAPADGATPRGGLTLGSDGNLYGTTLCGGANEKPGTCAGTVYRITTAGTFTLLHSFDADPAAATGAMPQAAPTEANGQLYGTTTGGGAGGFGTVFRVSKDGTGFAAVHDFGGGVMGVAGSLDGAAPVGRLLLATDGWLYGTTSQGGPNTLIYPKGDGTVFRVSPTNAYQLLHAFGSVAGDGAHPVTGLSQNLKGQVFGTLETGSVNGTGSVFAFPLPPAP